MIILGIDPGSIVCGYGLIEKKGKAISVVEYGVIKAKKRTEIFYDRLREIYLRLNSVIARNKPDYSVFETMFYSKNAQSLIKLSHARSSAILASLTNNIPIVEFTPREIKKSVTGNGNASKQQVQFMVKEILKIEETPEFYDVSDALATALCFHFKEYSEVYSKNIKDWKKYIEEHPEKVVKNI